MPSSWAADEVAATAYSFTRSVSLCHRMVTCDILWLMKKLELSLVATAKQTRGTTTWDQALQLEVGRQLAQKVSWQLRFLGFSVHFVTVLFWFKGCRWWPKWTKNQRLGSKHRLQISEVIPLTACSNGSCRSNKLLAVTKQHSLVVFVGPLAVNQRVRTSTTWINLGIGGHGGTPIKVISWGEIPNSTDVEKGHDQLRLVLRNKNLQLLVDQVGVLTQNRPHWIKSVNVTNIWHQNFAHTKLGFSDTIKGLLGSLSWRGAERTAQGADRTIGHATTAQSLTSPM